MNKAYLLTGGNMGNRKVMLQQAIKLLSEYCGKVTAESSLYETAAWGKTDQSAFLNQALELTTELNARQLIRKILKVEKLMGRERKEKYGPRIIDIDILLFNDEIYTLTPLAEIAPGIIHPVLKKTIKQLLADCPDKLEVKKII
jgi:2-amino-4-hydroxy-6-hydroxymethyldihydropteridine diphosphokinase